jgi:hypothetical protein
VLGDLVGLQGRHISRFRIGGSLPRQEMLVARPSAMPFGLRL